MFAEGAGGADLVDSHEAAIAGDVRRQNRCQSSLDTLTRHEAPRSGCSMHQTMAAGFQRPR